MKRLLALLHNLLKEIGDENAYQRHLKQVGRVHSAREWRAFSDAKHARKYRNAKCC